MLLRGSICTTCFCCCARLYAVNMSVYGPSMTDRWPAIGLYCSVCGDFLFEACVRVEISTFLSLVSYDSFAAPFFPGCKLLALPS